MPSASVAETYSPIEYQAEVNLASSTFDELLSPNSQWTDYGESHGVRIQRGTPPAIPGRDPIPGPSVLPLCRSETVIPDARPIQLLACVHQAAYLAVFQPRVRTAYYLRRYSQYHNKFYAVLAFGKGFESRDLVGVQYARFFDENGLEVGHPSERSSRIDLVFANVEDAKVPAQEGKVRASYWHAGFRFTRTEEGTRVQHISQIDFGEPIPAYIYKVMWLEIPMVVSRLREAYRLIGCPPYVLDPAQTIAMQLQSFDVETRAVSISALVLRTGAFAIVLDSKRMYKQGVFFSDRSGPAAKLLEIEEKEGNIEVRTPENAVGLAFELVFRACDQEVHDQDESADW
ncbi:hypothetical protein V8E36_003603 [Tilletia maclaganii]